MSELFTVPIIPNRPLIDIDEPESFGSMLLRENIRSGFVENSAFDPDLIKYDENYQNNQATSAAFLEHMRDVLTLLKSSYPKGSKLVDVGCGKGDFIEMLQTDGWFETQGFDDSYEGKNDAIEKRFLTVEDRLTADVVVLRHVLEHIQRPHDFLSLLQGIFGSCDIYIEVPEASWIWANEAFFDVTYEHVNYFSPTALASLFSETSERGALFGDQYQYVIANLDNLDSGGFEESYADSHAWKSLDFAEVFPNLVKMFQDLDEEVQTGRLFVWGAATKGVMFCHHLQRVAPHLLARVVAAIDINPMKAGRLLPSVRLPIVDVETYATMSLPSDSLLVMNPNYRDEIIKDLTIHGISDVNLRDI